MKTFETPGAFIWNPYLEPWNQPRNLLEPFMIGTYTWNLGTCRNLYLEPWYLEPRNLRNLTWNPYLEPRNLPEPLLGTLTRNLGTCRNLYLEPLLGTSEPARTWRDDCPRVPQGLVWLGPQSFQLLGNNEKVSKQTMEKQSKMEKQIKTMRVRTTVENKQRTKQTKNKTNKNNGKTNEGDVSPAHECRFEIPCWFRLRRLAHSGGFGNPSFLGIAFFAASAGNSHHGS